MHLPTATPSITFLNEAGAFQLYNLSITQLRADKTARCCGDESRLPEVWVLCKSALEVFVPRAQMDKCDKLVIGRAAAERQLGPRRRERRQVIIATVQHMYAELAVRVDWRRGNTRRRRQLLQSAHCLHRNADLHQVRLMVRQLTERMYYIWRLFCSHKHTRHLTSALLMLLVLYLCQATSFRVKGETPFLKESGGGLKKHEVRG